MPILPENLLREVFEIQCGRAFDEESESERRRFFNILRDSHKELSRSGNESVTLPAIRSWLLGKERRIPKREEAAQFLYNHLSLLTSGTKSWDSARKDRFDALVRYLGNRGSLPPANDSPAMPATTNLALRRPPRSWNGDQVTWSRALAISGTYQIIRPSASAQNRFALEVLSINVETNKRDQSVLMYAYTRKEKRYLYRGYININGRYFFCLLHRRNEDFPRRESFRSIVLFVPEGEECFSGIMLRGVTGTHNLKMAMGVPFIALKSTDMIDLSAIHEIAEKGYSIHNISGSLLLGEIRIDQEALSGIFGFCDKIFKRLQLQQNIVDSNLRIIRAIEPIEVGNLIDPNPKLKKGAYFSKWRRCVDRCDWSTSPSDIEVHFDPE